MLKLGKLFQNNMILQRGKDVFIWGTAEPESTVHISIQGKECFADCDAQGNWEGIISDLTASVSEILEVSSGDETITLNNVAVGEVWLAGGQSNMEFSMYYDQDYEAALHFCDDPMIRVYDVPKIASEEHKVRKDYSLFGLWRTSNSEDLKYFSAAAWFFAKSLRETLGVPVGIIGCNWDGSRSACWMDRETLMHCGPVWLREYEENLEKIEDPDAAKEAYFNNPMDVSHPFDNEFRTRMMRGLTLEETQELFAMFAAGDNPIVPVIGPWHEWRPLGLYEYMLKTIFPFTMRGVIFYQGECDEEHPDIYADMLEGLVSCWRKGFRDELPFIMTQLAPFGEWSDGFLSGGKYYPILREQQQKAAESISGVYLASTSDCGHFFDIHPKRKHPVGERLALLARGHVYGDRILCEAPMGKSLEREGNSLIITCSGAEGGLYIRGDKLNELCVETDEEKVLREDEYTVSVRGERIELLFPEGLHENGYRVKYARTPFYEVNIYNMAGIPMKPFEVADIR